jgi:2-succinyl-6-hydroxy-2,4-cyclohexadiene-1-carboxylate synthase
MDNMAADVAGIMDQLNLEHAHIIGSSLGAEVGLALAANYPAKVLTLVCDGALSSAYGPYGTWEGSEGAFEEHVIDMLNKMAARPKTTFPTVEALIANRREMFEQYIGWNADIETLERYAVYETAGGQFATGLSKAANAGYMKNYFHYRFEDYYPQVNCPLLMVPDAGDLEDQLEKAAREGLCALAVQGQIVTVAGWDHPYGWLLKPHGMVQAILNFFD